MGSKERQIYVKFQRTIGLIILLGFGIIPIMSLYFLDLMLFHPYVALVSVISGSYIYTNSRKYSRSGEIHDR